LAEIAGDSDAAPALTEALEDDELAEIWDVAYQALASIGPAVSPARSLLVDLYACPVAEIQEVAKRAIAAIDRSRAD
jgi:hypothetical protein